MISAKRKWEEAQAQALPDEQTQKAQALAEAQKALAEAEEQLHELYGMLEERNVLEKRIDLLYKSVVAWPSKILGAGSVQREMYMKVLETCQNNLREQQEIAKELPQETEILSQIKSVCSQIKEFESQIEDLSAPTYMDMVLASVCPSVKEKMERYMSIQMRVPNQQLYECATAQPPLPVSLAHHVFGEFLDDFSDVSAPFGDDVCDFVVEVCFDVLGRMQKFEDEVEFQKAFNLKMEGFLGHVVSIEMVSHEENKENKAISNLTVRKGLWWLICGELKLERGCTLAQVLQSYAYYSGSLKAKTQLLPCFSVEVIGSTVRIGGFIFFEKVAWQPLTPFMNCFYTEYDRTDMATLCRAMRALKKGAITLDSYYNQAPSTRTITPKHIPYPLQVRQSVRIDNKLIFIVTCDNGERRIFKYCRQYGEEVHRSWADAGLAPILYDCKPIAGGWLEVEMEYLADWSPSSALLEEMDVAARHELREAISTSLRKALAILIDDRPVAHGDMRPPNIMIKRGDGGCFDIKFIDFDWAGKVGVARYPPFMNTARTWHPDVGAGKELAQDHDTFWWMETAINL